MKRILGIDLGVGSMGWSLIEVDNDNNPTEIVAMGSRIVPLSADDTNEFTTGKAITKNQKRTEKRTARKGYFRYQQRRENLTIAFRELGMLPDEKLIKLPVIDLWQLRADAATPDKKLTLPEIGRVLYHINQRRGYKHAKADEGGDSKQREYVSNVNKRHALIIERGQTIGQYFAEQLKSSEIKTDKGVFYTYRIKEQVFPRKAYEEEFDQIIKIQKEFYPEILTEQVINRLRNEIIFYQRGLKSCKHLVSICEFEKKEYRNAKGEIVFDGPKVAPRTSPLFQVCKMWESINNIKLTNRNNEIFPITQEHRKLMFEHLDNNEKLGIKDLYKILGISTKEGWWGGKAIGKGLQGNTTKNQLKKALASLPVDKINKLLEFNLSQCDSRLVDEDTGEIIPIINHSFIEEPLYKLWHAIYSIQDKNELKKTLAKSFSITDEEIISKLYKIDFVKPGYGNKSAKAMRRILPFLQNGEMYSDACTHAGFRHSDSLTKEENEVRILLEKLPQIQKNELRQPIVEKILNQMVNVVNAIIDKYGKPDTIRVELARELKMSKDERESMDKNMRARERENEAIKAKILEFDGVKVSRNRVQKYRMWQESQECCFYCGERVSAAEFLNGFDVEIEHIIPRSLFFDDSFSNKVCACRKCNASKGNMTGYDFMKSKSEDAFQRYLTRIDEAFKEHRISKTKRDRLLTTASEIPTDFIDRDLRLSQYISRKSVEILKQICKDVHTTTGSVTDFVRRVWGYDMVLHNLNIERYRKGELTEIVEFDHKGQIHKEERIVGWSKRIDHRHHAIDALVIAMTQQSFIQRLNHLNTERDQMFAEIEKQREEWRNDFSMLEQWLRERPHFTVAEVEKVVSEIMVSFKAGKKVATKNNRIKYVKGKKIVLQENIIAPRGALSQESVYGKIRILEKNKPIKYAFENPHLIFKGYIKRLIEERLAQFEGDYKKAVAALKKSPIMIGANKDVPLAYVTCYKDEYVIKYPITSLQKMSDIDSIVDENIKSRIKARIAQFDGKIKEAFKDLDNNPIYADDRNSIPIKNVRCFTGLNAVTPLKYNDKGEAISFVKPGNNHHIAIYRDKDGNLQEHVVSFWTAVERKKYGVPVVIKSPADVWDSLTDKDLPEAFFATLPDVNWTFVESMQVNEMFILGLSEEEFNDAIINNDKATLCNHLYRVQKISNGDYFFRLHIETSVDDKYNGVKNASLSVKMDKLKRIGIQSLFKLNYKKIQTTTLGEIRFL
ncbi:MAG: type II CRISPR RNA-guided endonuclease Cas9 [Muribaculaceae bacterium]|nr:type II CRISPR RNA-guided endonuclease Cas9 [Muribaculaceae bacterium]